MGNNYKVINGISFDTRTPNDLCILLASLNLSRTRVRIWYGDKDTGVCWDEENDVIGYIGRSTGQNKIPLLIANKRSWGGGSLLDHFVLRVQDIKTKRVLWQADNFQMPVYEIGAAYGELVALGYTVSVWRNNENVANFKKRTSAENWIAFMTGKRFTK